MLGRIDERTELILKRLVEIDNVNQKQQDDIDSLKVWRGYLSGGLLLLSFMVGVLLKVLA